MYTNADFIRDCKTLFGDTEGNTVDIPGIGPTVLFEEPLIGFADAGDEIFETFRRKEVVGPNYMAPAEWLTAARTVVSMFLPFSEAVRSSNRADKTDPSDEWLYARIEGQEFIGKYMETVKQCMEEHGIDACVPSSDPLDPDARNYTGIDDYCVKCGVCALNCPGKAISLRHGKNNIKCNKYVEAMKKKYSPRYGCGKCQVGVPCEFRKPGK